MLYGQVPKAIAGATSKGLSFIDKHQLTGGGFYSYSTLEMTDFSQARAYRTSFFPSLIAGALELCHTELSKNIKNRVHDFLILQKSDQASYGYWDRTSTEAKDLPYPDDLDDTFCALIALFQANKLLFDGDLTASIARLLISVEAATGGPYRTWLVADTAPKRWQDIDIAVNANVARFLALQGVELPNITSFLEQAIAADRLDSPYYPNAYSIMYFIAPWYRGKYVPSMIEKLLSLQSNEDWQNPLHTSLIITALLRLGYPATKLKPAVDSLLVNQLVDGSWPAGAFCIDPSQRGKRAYAGSATLTTALCLEALAHFSLHSPTLAPGKPAKVASGRQYQQVVSQVRTTIRQVESSDLRLATGRVLRRLLAQDKDLQIVLLPWLVAETIENPSDVRLLSQLAAASLWGWMAYTVYDDFLDNEGDPSLLPAANFCMRNLVITLMGILPENSLFQEEVQVIMDRLDAANAWEIAHCRGKIKDNRLSLQRLPDYGDYWQLADRSLGHTIAGLGVLYAADLGHDAVELVGFREFFKQYLIARQLSDDLHDWEDDLRNGHCNAVAVEILRPKFAAKVVHIDLARDMEGLRLVLWETVVPSICAKIKAHVAAGTKALQYIPRSAQKPFTDLLAVHEAIADQALSGRADALAFIKKLAD